MEINLSNTKQITLRQAEVINTDKLVINRIVDSPRRRKLSVVVEGLGEIELWKDEEYDNKGNWTYSDIELKLKNLYDV